MIGTRIIIAGVVGLASVAGNVLQGLKIRSLKKGEKEVSPTSVSVDADTPLEAVVASDPIPA